MRKIEYKIIFLSLIFGLFAWIIDAALDSILFYEGTFLDLLILDIPKHEMYIRLVILAGFAIFGIIMSNVIIKRKNAENALKDSEDMYHDLYDNAPDMFCSVDAATAKIIKCNNTLVKTTGYTKEEIIGRPIFEMYHPDSIEAAKMVFKSFVETGEVNNAELQLKRKNGKKIDVILNVTSIRNEKGEVLYSRSSWRDITKRKNAEKEREKLIQELRTTLEEVKTLRGFIPICANCKKIRNDDGFWQQVDTYIHEHTGAEFSHGICPECVKKLYPELE